MAEPITPRATRWLQFALAALPYVVYLFLVFLLFNQVYEDSFIYFRVADNIAQGYGYVFNRGSESVETGSGLLWQLLLALGALLSFDLLLFSKWLGAALGFAALWLSVRIVRQLGVSRWVAPLAALFLACSAPFYIWSHRGLETSQFVCVLLALIYCCVNPRLQRYWPLAAIALIASRPEGFLLLAGFAPWLWLRFRQRRAATLAGLAWVAGAFAALALARLFYFHDFVPHAYYSKGASHLEQGLMYFADYAMQAYLWPAAGVALAGLAVRRHHRDTWLVILPITLLTLAWFWYAGPELTLGYRQLVPFLACFGLLLATAVDAIADRLRRPALVALPAAALTLAMALLAPVGLQWGKPLALGALVAEFGRRPGDFLAEFRSVNALGLAHVDRLGLRINEPAGNNFQAKLGKFIAERYPEHTTFIYDQMGQTPWYAGPNREFVDSFGLTDQRLGHFVWRECSRQGPLLKAYGATLAGARQLAGAPSPFAYDADALIRYMAEEKQPTAILIHSFVTNFGCLMTTRLHQYLQHSDTYYLRYRLTTDDSPFFPILIYEKRPAGAAAPSPVDMALR